MNAASMNAAARAATGLTLSGFSAHSGIGITAVRAMEKRGTADHPRLEAARTWLRESCGIAVDDASRSISIAADLTDRRQAGRVLAAARALAGLSQADLAASADVSLRTVGSLEGGHSLGLGAVRDAIVAALRAHGASIERDQSGGTTGWRIVASDGNCPAPTASPFDPEPDAATAEAATAEAKVAEEPHKALADRHDRVDYLRLRAEVDGTEPAVWREIMVPRTTSFFELHAILQTAFGWRRYHTHEFHCGVTIGNLSHFEGPVGGSRPVDERLVTLQMLAWGSRSITYVYDLGDNWSHTLTVLGEEAAVDGPARPHVVAGAGAPIAEDVGGEERWNELAAALRKGKPPRDLGEWLEDRGYGRRYDPDAFDIGAVNAELAASGYSMPTSWREDLRRRNAPARLPADYPAPPAPPRFADAGLEVVAVVPFGSGTYRKKAIGDNPQGWCHVPSRDRTTSIPARGQLSPVIKLLEQCVDVVSFETLPVRVDWKDGKSKGSFVPDFLVSWSDGGRSYIHVAFDEEEARFCRRLKASGTLDVRVIGSGVLDHPATRIVRDACYWRNSAGVPGKSMRDVLERAGGGKPLPIAEAVRVLLAEGFGHQEGISGGTPQGRTKSRILGAVARGEIGLDFGKPVEATSVGPLSLTERSARFREIASPYVA